MSKINIFLVLAFFCNIWAVPYKVETVKEGTGDGIHAGQLIKVHFKGYLILDSLQMIEYAAMQEVQDVSVADSIKDTTKVVKDSAQEVATADSIARYKNKRLYASSYDGEALEFTLGLGQVIEGWERGINGMKVGEIRYITVPSTMAYGDRSLEGIPPNSDLYFEVELMHAEKPMVPDQFPKNINQYKWKDAHKGLKIYDEKVGNGKPAVVGATLKTHYTGWLVSGRKFGSSKDGGKPLSVTMGMGKMIKGWEVGLEGMSEGGVRWLRVEPSMGYGAKAYTLIPSNSTLIFRVELVSSEMDEEIAGKMDFFPDTSALKFENGSEGLRYAVINEGSGEPAKEGGVVKVHYTGWLTNGYKFDSSRDRNQEFKFKLGGGQVIRGWELGVVGMRPGEKRILVIPPGLGYGNRPSGPIPGGSTLIFAVEYLGD